MRKVPTPSLTPGPGTSSAPPSGALRLTPPPALTPRPAVPGAARRDALAASPRADEAGAEAPAITIGELDRALDELGATTGAGSVAARASLLDGLLGRASIAEIDFIADLLTGGLRQGALEG